MEKGTINQLVQDKNKESERAVLRSAESLIDQIAKEQETIQRSQARISELRKELHSLEVKQISTKDILGES